MRCWASKASPSQNPYSIATPFAMSENVAVPLSAATQHGEKHPDCRAKSPSEGHAEGVTPNDGAKSEPVREPAREAEYDCKNAADVNQSHLRRSRPKGHALLCPKWRQEKGHLLSPEDHGG